jgi:uncharacterized protein with PIN domain
MDEKLKEIPQNLRNDDGNLHSHCRVCNAYLLNENSQYYLEKVVRRVPELETEQVLFEFAVCAHCLGELRKSLSKESKAAMEHFFASKIKETFALRPETNVYTAFDEKRCLITGRSAEEFETYQMAAFCQGTKLHPQQPPMLIGDSVIEESSELLSAETRNELNDFLNNNFGWPPEFAKLLTEGDLALL